MKDRDLIERNRIEGCLDGFLLAWEDAWGLQGKRAVAVELKPYARAALSGTVYFKAFTEGRASFYAWYLGLPIGKRRKVIQQNIRAYKMPYWDDVYLSALNYKKTRDNADATMTQFEDHLEQEFLQVLDEITLPELEQNFDNLSDNEKELLAAELLGDSFLINFLRKLLSCYGLKPGSIAGGDAYLYRILKDRRYGNPQMGYGEKEDLLQSYETDLKVALWQVAKGDFWAEFLKEVKARGTVDRAAELIRSVLEGKERQLIRTILIKTLRKAIEQAFDIKRERARKVAKMPKIQELPLPEYEDVRFSYEDEYKDRQENILDMLQQRGAPVDRLTPRELDNLNEELGRYKQEKTRENFFGKEKAKKEQQFKRLKDKLNPPNK